MGFPDKYRKEFEDFLLALNTLSNARLTNKIIDPVTLERHIRDNSI